MLLYCSIDATAQEITPCTRYLSIHSPEKADASGLLLCVSEALKFMGVENVSDKDSVLGVEGRPVFVEGGTDRASVNVGVHTGLKAQMQQALPWLYWSWCYAHRLELACKNAFSSSLFTNIVEMLLRLFYIYEKSPNKSYKLANIVDYISDPFLNFQKEDTFLFDHMEQEGHTQKKSSSACTRPLWSLHTSFLHSYRRQLPQAR